MDKKPANQTDLQKALIQLKKLSEQMDIYSKRQKRAAKEEALRSTKLGQILYEKRSQR